jgi:rubrerythrin
MNIDIQDNGMIVLSDFNALQAYKIARKMESDGMIFYQSLLAESHTSKLNSAIKYLLESEKDHFHFFEQKIADLQAESEDSFEEEDIADFISANIFTHEELEQRENIDLSKAQSALSFGMICEAKSIAFYSALLQNTTDLRAVEAIKAIIEEEKKHLNTLREFV